MGGGQTVGYDEVSQLCGKCMGLQMDYELDSVMVSFSESLEKDVSPLPKAGIRRHIIVTSMLQQSLEQLETSIVLRRVTSSHIGHSQIVIRASSGQCDRTTVCPVCIGLL